MASYIKVENGLVSTIDEVINYQVPLKDWLARIEKRYPIATPVLPLGTRALIWDQTDLTDQKLVVLIEQQPQIIRLSFMGEIHELSIPWTRFFFYADTQDPTNNMAWRLGDYRVFWAKSQYRDPDALDMIPALVPNVYSDGRICFGSTSANMEQTLAERLNQTCNEFWVSDFNRDITVRRPEAARTWRKWERMTQKDPTGWMNWTDWDVNSAPHAWFSFNSLLSGRRIPDINANRLAPVISADGIPEVPMGATIGRINEWLDQFTDEQRDRMLQAMLRDRALNNGRYATVDDTELLDEEDESPEQDTTHDVDEAIF